MPTLSYRSLLVGSTLMVALLSSGSAEAQQYYFGPGSGPDVARRPGALASNITTGVQYDLVNQQLAENRLHRILTRPGGGHPAFLGGRPQRIADLRYRIAVDEWLIRKNSLQEPGIYPVRTDPESIAALNQATRLVPVYTSPVLAPDRAPAPNFAPAPGLAPTPAPDLAPAPVPDVAPMPAPNP